MTYAASPYAYSYPNSWFPPSYDYGASQESSVIRNAFTNLKKQLNLAATWQRKEEFLSNTLEALIEAIANPLQYEEESAQASDYAIREATQLLQALPEGIPQADITMEPSGAIAFEWYKDEKNTFVISTNGTGSLEYAAIHGTGNEMHGRVNFAGDFPRTLNNLLTAFIDSTP